MAATDWEVFPSYLELYNGIADFLVKTYHEKFVEERKPLQVEATWSYCNFCTYDILILILSSIIWTVLRHVATEKLFKPLAHHYALTPTNQKKMPESAWKFLYYLCAWSYTLYVLILSGHYHFFQKPSTVWDDWNLERRPPLDIYLMYMGQCGFYLHSLYATLFLDTWRKDSSVMMIHHVLTFILISISYSLRYHNIGVLVLFFHDGCDILLEFTKLNVYFKIQKNRLVKAHEMMANFTFLCFAVSWYVFRLYLYPLRVLYSATAVVQQQQLVLPCALLMNTLLWILQILNIYWFMFIMQFLFRVATGQVQEVDDTREYDVEEKLLRRSSKSQKVENGVSNGNVQANGNCGDVSNGNLLSKKEE